MTGEDRTIDFGECWVTIGPNWVVTGFPDGTEVHAHPIYDDEQRARARSLGYVGLDHEAVDAMTRDHDYYHTIVARELGYEYSPTLWAVAHGESIGALGDYEERVVFERQKRENDS